MAASEQSKDRSPNAPSSACTAVLCLALLAFGTIAVGGDMFDRVADREANAHRVELRKALGLSLVPGVRPGSLGSARRNKVREHLSPLLATLPRNRRGLLSASVMRYTLNRYLSKQHGWNVKGFESWRSNTTRLGDAVILKEKVPGYAQDVLNERLASSGFSDEDAVMLIAAVEQLIFDDIVESVESAYQVNGLSSHDKVGRSDMTEVVHSVMVEGIHEGNFSDARVHLQNKRQIGLVFPPWNSLTLFIEDTISASAFEANLVASPFARVNHQQKYVFEETAGIATRVMDEFGPWANFECKTMHEALVAMDPHSTGRVPISDFYASSAHDGKWHFQEKTDYLRQGGSLDESSEALGPQVIIANYVQGMSNCMVSTKYYSVCCMKECEDIQQKLEARLRLPAVPVADVAQAIQAIWGRDMGNGTKLYADLEKVATLNDGKVPLHSRLFLQWLHFTFPHQCPYPHANGLINPMTAGQMQAEHGIESVVASENVIWDHAMKPKKAPSPLAGNEMWSTHEEHMPASSPHDSHANFNDVILMCLPWAFLAALCATIGGVTRIVRARCASVEEIKGEATV